MKSNSPQHEEPADLGNYGPLSIDGMDNYTSRIFNCPNGGSAFDAIETYNYQVAPAPQTDCTTVTATNKPLMVTNLDVNWKGRHPRTWTSSHFVEWVYNVFTNRNLNYESLSAYNLVDNINGESLMQMTKVDFQNRFPHGEIIFDCFQDFLSEFNPVDDPSSVYTFPNPIELPYQYDNWDSMNNNHSDNGNNIIGIADIKLEQQVVHIPNQHAPSHVYDSSAYLLPNNYSNGGSLKSEVDSEGESNQSFSYGNPYSLENVLGSSENAESQRRKRGRPQLKDKRKNKNGQRSSRLWEFIRDLLLDPKTCPSLLKWENVEEGIFRFVQSDQVAKLWGKRKCNPRMTYEKLSRAMRYYYKNKVFQSVTGRRLVYKFGPTATGWRPNELPTL